MINTNTPAKNESHLANALGILDVIEYCLECLAEDKPIIWKDTHGNGRSATTEETARDLLDHTLFLRIELEEMREKLTALLGTFPPTEEVGND